MTHLNLTHDEFLKFINPVSDLEHELANRLQHVMDHYIDPEQHVCEYDCAECDEKDDTIKELENDIERAIDDQYDSIDDLKDAIRNIINA